MNKLLSTLFSMRWASVGLIAFLVAIAIATFIESTHGIQAAKITIYNASWFEGLLLYLALALVSNIFHYQMWKREKIAMFSFHLSFLVILLGAAITRFVSFEGLMVIKEGTSKNFIYTADPYLLVNAQELETGKQSLQAWKTYLSEYTSNNFEHEIGVGKKIVKLRYLGFMSDRVDSLVINQKINSNALELVTDGMRSNYLCEEDLFMVGQTPFFFTNAKPSAPGIYLSFFDNKVMVYPSVPLKSLPMSEMQKVRASGQAPADSLYKEFPLNEWSEFTPLTLYLVGGQQVVFKRLIPHAKKALIKAPNKNTGKDYLSIEINDGKARKKLQLEADKVKFREIFENEMNKIDN